MGLWPRARTAGPSARAPGRRAARRRAAAAQGAAAAAPAGAPADAERARPAQLLLRALGGAAAAGAGGMAAGEVAATARLMAEFEVAPPPAILDRYCQDAAARWSDLSDAALVGAPASLALVGAAPPGGGWLEACAGELLGR